MHTIHIWKLNTFTICSRVFWLYNVHIDFIGIIETITYSKYIIKYILQLYYIITHVLCVLYLHYTIFTISTYSYIYIYIACMIVKNDNLLCVKTYRHCEWVILNNSIAFLPRLNNHNTLLPVYSHIHTNYTTVLIIH